MEDHTRQITDITGVYSLVTDTNLSTDYTHIKIAIRQTTADDTLFIHQEDHFH